MFSFVSLHLRCQWLWFLGLIWSLTVFLSKFPLPAELMTPLSFYLTSLERRQLSLDKVLSKESLSHTQPCRLSEWQSLWDVISPPATLKATFPISWLCLLDLLFEIIFGNLVFRATFSLNVPQVSNSAWHKVRGHRTLGDNFFQVLPFVEEDRRPSGTHVTSRRCCTECSAESTQAPAQWLLSCYSFQQTILFSWFWIYFRTPYHLNILKYFCLYSLPSDPYYFLNLS